MHVQNFYLYKNETSILSETRNWGIRIWINSSRNLVLTIKYMGLILDQIVEGICVTVREPPKWSFWSASIPLFCWFYSLFLYNHSFIFFFYLFFYFLNFFSCDLSWRSRRELYCLIVWMVRSLWVNILCIYVFLYFFIHSFISFIFVFHLPSWAWGLCLQSEGWTSLWSKRYLALL